MSSFRTQCLRDPVHGLITFPEGSEVDELAWKLIQTPEFQRLRRIKQLGVSEFVFPGATHTRFAHCVGVFHTARTLVELVERQEPEAADPKRGEVAVIAALLHDLGHGPFSHTFEEVQKSRGVDKTHEKWTAEIIRNTSGHVHPLLEDFRKSGDFCEKKVASLLESEEPSDIYHAVVSSSLDADRLDYLQRDRLMTGTGAGAIDFDWILEHVRVRWVTIDAADEDNEDRNRPKVPTFCLDLKALPAAEQFLLARYTLQEQVYFHKTTRCIEQMIGLLLAKLADHASDEDNVQNFTGLSNQHPLILFFARNGETIHNYLRLDDVIISGALSGMANAADVRIADLAARIRDRRLFKTLDVRTVAGTERKDQAMLARRIDEQFAEKFGREVLRDDRAKLSIYTQVGGDDEKAHKKLRILDGANGTDKEISNVSKVISALAESRPLLRYYFESSEDRDVARGLGRPS